MVGKWLGNDVPAAGISIGFERVIELVETQGKSAGVVLVLEDNSLEVITKAVAFQKQLIASGKTVRLEIKPKKLNVLLDSLVANGFIEFALVSASSSLELKSIQ
jgi:histidyl-tRNA synthetase